jgi:hypothetical protein
MIKFRCVLHVSPIMAVLRFVQLSRQHSRRPRLECLDQTCENCGLAGWKGRRAVEDLEIKTNICDTTRPNIFAT